MSAKVTIEHGIGYRAAHRYDMILGYVYCSSCKEPNKKPDLCVSPDQARETLGCYYDLDELRCDQCGKPWTEWPVESVPTTYMVEHTRARIF